MHYSPHSIAMWVHTSWCWWRSGEAFCACLLCHCFWSRSPSKLLSFDYKGERRRDQEEKRYYYTHNAHVLLTDVKACSAWSFACLSSSNCNLSSVLSFNGDTPWRGGGVRIWSCRISWFSFSPPVALLSLSFNNSISRNWSRYRESSESKRWARSKEMNNNKICTCT